jgi:hypothetical protein
MILDQRKFFLAVKEKPFQKIYIFRKILINLLVALQGLWMVLLAKNHVGEPLLLF